MDEHPLLSVLGATAVGTVVGSVVYYMSMPTHNVNREQAEPLHARAPLPPPAPPAHPAPLPPPAHLPPALVGFDIDRIIGIAKAIMTRKFR